MILTPTNTFDAVKIILSHTVSLYLLKFDAYT